MVRGLGAALAEELHELGNQVIISGRRRVRLEETIKANAGMQAVELNVEDPASIAAVAERLIQDFPTLNVLINNAGVMRTTIRSTAMPDDAAGVDD